MSRNERDSGELPATAQARLSALTGELERLEQGRDALSALLDALPFGWILVGEDGGTLLSNARAGALVTPEVAAAIRNLLSCLRRPLTAATVGDVIIVLKPVPQASDPFISNRPAAVAYLLSKHGPNATASALLREVFGLTGAETSVTGLLLQGASPRDIARSLDISPHTVRTHLRHIMEKTQTHRQGELVALLCAITPIAGPPSDASADLER